MRKVPYLVVLIGIGCLSFANPSLASPLASGLLDSRVPSVTEGWVQKVQAWSCQEKLRDMTIQQRRNCHGYGGPGYRYRYLGYGYGYPGYGYGYGSPGYGLGVAPFFGFQFSDDDYDHHQWRRHHRRHY
jgi:hypothetical protein